MSELVKMVREEPVHPGGPSEAMVPREEVENWWRHGWQVAEEPKPEAEAPEASLLKTGPETDGNGGSKPKKRGNRNADNPG